MKEQEIVFDYPMHYLSSQYLQPTKMRKDELATLLKRSWRQVRKEIERSEKLQKLLELTNYRPELKMLYPEHVAVFFSYFTPPLKTVKNEALYNYIVKAEMNDLQDEFSKIGLTFNRTGL